MASEQDFFNFYNSLGPAEQRKFLTNFGGTQENLDDQSAFGDFGSEMPTELGGFGAPQQDLTSQLLGQMAGGAYPQYTAAGKLDPLDLGQLGQRLNYTQDLGGSMFDNAVALFAGPDAFGSMDQFTPQTKYTGDAVPAQLGEDGQPRPVTKSQMALDVAKRSGGARGFIADLIDQGQDPDAAVAALRQLVTSSTNATNLTPEQKKQVNDIRNTLDVWRTNDPVTGATKAVDRATAPWESFDEDSLRKSATDMFEQKLTDEMASSTLEFDPQSGKYYQGKTTEDSPAAKKFRDAGLPTPNEQYTDPARMQAMMGSIDPGGYDRSQGLQQQQMGADDQLEQHRQKLLASQLDLQGYDQRLNAISQPGPAPSSTPTGRGGAPVSLPPGFSFQTQPNAPTLQGLNQAGQPAVQMPRTVTDSFGRPRSVTPQDFNFDLTQQIFQNMPKQGQGVSTDRRLQQRNAPAQRQANQQSQKQWNDEYNKNYAAVHNRQSTPEESNADFMAGMMRARARQTTPLQDTMLARLMSLKSRAGI